MGLVRNSGIARCGGLREEEATHRPRDEIGDKSRGEEYDEVRDHQLNLRGAQEPVVFVPVFHGSDYALDEETDGQKRNQQQLCFRERVPADAEQPGIGVGRTAAREKQVP